MGPDDGRYLLLYVKARDSACFRDPYLWQLWSWLLMEAKAVERAPGRARRVAWNGAERQLERGQITVNYARLAEELACSKSTIHRRLKKMSSEKLKQIIVESGTHFSVITILNYKRMQPDWHEMRNASGTQVERERNVLIESENLRRGESSPPPPLPLNRAELSDERRARALALISECQKIAEATIGRTIDSFGALPQMLALMAIKEPDTIVEVFQHFVSTRREPLTVTFDNFFRYFGQHYASCVKALAERIPHESGNGRGSQAPTTKQAGRS